jgi:hypothetical protein
MALRLTSRTTAGIRTAYFSNAVRFLKGVMNLEIVYSDKEKEFVQFKLPSGKSLEVFGSKSLWQCFTTTPDWEIIIADVRRRKENGSPDAEGDM